MTNRGAYVFGWVFGRLNAAAYPQEIGGISPLPLSARIQHSPESFLMLTGLAS